MERKSLAWFFLTAWIGVTSAGCSRSDSWAPDKNSVAAADAALNNAEAALELAQGAYDQVAWMPAVGASPQSLQLEQATNNLNVAQANLN